MCYSQACWLSHTLLSVWFSRRETHLASSKIVSGVFLQSCITKIPKPTHFFNYFVAVQQTLTWYHVILFPLMGSAVLLILFYLFDYIQFVFTIVTIGKNNEGHIQSFIALCGTLIAVYCPN